MNRKVFLILICTIGWCFSESNGASKENKRFVVYYSDAAAPEGFFDYDVLVFDSLKHPPLEKLKSREKDIYGYLSIGAINQKRPYYERVAKDDLLLGQLPNYPESKVVDARNPKWAAMVVEELIPDLLHRGFNGIFLDNLDVLLHLQKTDPKKYAGMDDSIVHLIKTIRLNFPDVKIMVNRGFSVLPEVASQIDGILLESTLGGYDFDKKEYGTVPRKAAAPFIAQIKRLVKKHPKLEIYSLDYCREDDAGAIKAIYNTQRTKGFIPYVSVIELNQVRGEPK